MKNKIEVVLKVKRLHRKLSRRPQKRDSSSLYRYSRKLFGSWNNLMKAAGYKVKYNQKVAIAPLSAEMAYFLGILITDGHIYYNDTAKHYKVAVYTSYPEEKEILLQLIHKLFGYKASVRSRNYGFSSKVNFEIGINSEKLANHLRIYYRIPSGAKSLTVRIPAQVSSSHHSIKEAFIKGVIDGDGSITKGSVKIASGSKKFLEDLRMLFWSLDIKPGNVIADNKNSKTLSIRVTNKEGLRKIEGMYHNSPFYPRKKKRFKNI